MPNKKWRWESPLYIQQETGYENARVLDFTMDATNPSNIAFVDRLGRNFDGISLERPLRNVDVSNRLTLSF